MSGNPSSNTILCAGRLYCDLVFTGVPNLPVMGTETFSKELTLHAGGGAFISAATFSALGWNTKLLARLPSAPFNTIVQRDIDEFGLGTNLCVKAAATDAPQITVAIAGTQDRAFLSHKAGAAMPEVDLPKGQMRHLHIGELRSLVEHPNLIEKARSAGMTISVDCSWDAELLQQGADVNGLLSRIDVFLPNETEYTALISSGLREGSTPLTVVKCGNKGALALKAADWISEPSHPATVVDATGAGDAFNGGFLSSWLTGSSLSECLINGNRCGRASVKFAGGTGGLLTLREGLDVGQERAAQ